MTYFLLDYDRDQRRLVSITPIEDSAEALAAYSSAEREALGTPHEVVLLGAESERDLRLTHSRYFFEFPKPGRANGAGRRDFRDILAGIEEWAARLPKIGAPTS